MIDVFYIFLAIVFFFIAYLMVRLCEKV